MIIGHSIASPEVLVRFLRLFGGMISASSDGISMQKPTIRCQVSGENARHAAAVLAIFPSERQRQLELLAEFPSNAKRRFQLSDMIAELNRSHPDPVDSLSCIAGLAGFL